MASSDNLRIEGYAPSYQGGHASAAFVLPRHSRAQRLHALFAAIDAADLDAAHRAMQALLNFDPQLGHDPDMVKINKALQDHHVYAAQHFVHEYQARLAHEMAAAAAGHPVVAHPPVRDVAHSPPLRLGEDGHPHIDTLA